MTLNLHDLDTPLEPVRFVTGGPEYAFHHVNGISEQLLVSVRGAEVEERRAAYNKVLAQCLPDAPADEIAALPFWKADLLISLAGKVVDTVEEYMVQFAGKAEATAEASPSATPSPTPSPESPKPSAGGRKMSGAGRTG